MGTRSKQRQRTLDANLNVAHGSEGVNVLPLRKWMTMTDHPAWPSTATGVGATRFNRDGYYRQGDICWFEYQGKAYWGSVEDFRYEMYLLNIPSMNNEEYDACKYLADRGMLTKDMLKRFNDVKVKRRLRAMEIDTKTRLAGIMRSISEIKEANSD